MGNGVDLGVYYNEGGGDEVVFVDIWKREGGDDVMIEVIEGRGKELFMRLRVGGGIENLDDIREVLNEGGDKI